MPFTPSMKLNALTKPISQTARTMTPAAITVGGSPIRPISTPAIARLASPCMASLRPAGRPPRSSAKPMAAKAATPIANITATVPWISSTATTSPAAIGAPPPRGVGTLCDDRPFGMSTAVRRSSGMSSGSATVTHAAHITAARTVVSSPGTSQDTSDGNDGA